MLIAIGCAVSVKRVCLGYYFGQRICGTYDTDVLERSRLNFFSNAIYKARYSDDLHELLEKLLLLSEIATLSFAPRIVSTDLNVSIDVASQQSSDQAIRKSEITINEFKSSHTFQKLLEEWDEPIQSAVSDNVRFVLFRPCCDEPRLVY